MIALAFWVVAQGAPERWKTTLDLWADLDVLPEGALDEAEHKLLARTLSSRTWSSELLGKPAREFVRRAFERKIARTLKGPARAATAREAWGTIERELEELDRIVSSGDAHRWALARFMDLCDDELAPVAGQTVEKRLKDVDLDWGAYRDRVERFAQRFDTICRRARLHPRGAWEGHLPAIHESPRAIEFRGRRNGWVQLGLTDTAVNVGPRGEELNFFDARTGVKLVSVVLEPRAVLLGCELRARLSSKAQPLVDALISRLQEKEPPPPWHFHLWGRLAMDPIRKAAWEGHPARDRLLEILGSGR
jgi:hypothetical protein